MLLMFRHRGLSAEQWALRHPAFTPAAWSVACTIVFFSACAAATWYAAVLVPCVLAFAGVAAVRTLRSTPAHDAWLSGVVTTREMRSATRFMVLSTLCWLFALPGIIVLLPLGAGLALSAFLFGAYAQWMTYLWWCRHSPPLAVQVGAGMALGMPTLVVIVASTIAAFHLPFSTHPALQPLGDRLVSQFQHWLGLPP
jgi:hypothetical protein